MFSLIRGVFTLSADNDVTEQTECYSPFDTLREAEEFHFTLPTKNESYYEIVPIRSPMDNIYREVDLRQLNVHELFGIWFTAKLQGQKADSLEVALLDTEYDKLGRDGIIAWIVQQRVQK